MGSYYERWWLSLAVVTINDEIIVAGLMHPLCNVIEYNDVHCVLYSAGSLVTIGNHCQHLTESSWYYSWIWLIAQPLKFGVEYFEYHIICIYAHTYLSTSHARMYCTHNTWNWILPPTSRVSKENFNILRTQVICMYLGATVVSDTSAHVQVLRTYVGWH